MAHIMGAIWAQLGPKLGSHIGPNWGVIEAQMVPKLGGHRDPNGSKLGGQGRMGSNGAGAKGAQRVNLANDIASTSSGVAKPLTSEAEPTTICT